jgi:hypothetical protein
LANSLDNLRPNITTTEQAQALGRKGGLASVESKRRKKTMRENAELLLSLPLKEGKLKEQIKALGLSDDDLTNQMAMMASMLRKALSGDVNAFNTLQATIGEKPVAEVVLTPKKTDIDVEEIKKRLPPVLHEKEIAIKEVKLAEEDV